MINHIKTSLLKKIPVEVDKLCENLYYSFDTKTQSVMQLNQNLVLNSAIIVMSKVIIESLIMLYWHSLSSEYDCD